MNWAIFACAIACLFELSMNSCIYHPADRKQTCLDKPIDCSVPGCSLCLKGVCMECEAGKWLNFETSKCEQCALGCQRCTGSSEQQCFQLESNHFKNTDDRIQRCPGDDCHACGYDMGSKTVVCLSCPASFRPIPLGNPAATRAVQCTKCEVSNCLDCTIGEDRCENCLPGFELVGDSECRPKGGKCAKYDYRGNCIECPANQRWSYTSSSCVYCPKECTNCEYPGKCSNCDRGFRLNPVTDSCLPCEIDGCISCLDSTAVCDTCAPGKYFDLLTKDCRPCHSSCAVCTGPNDSDCRACTLDKKYQTIYYGRLDSDIIKQEFATFRKKFPEVMSFSFYMDINFHPDSDHYCLPACKTSADFGDRFEENLDHTSPNECQPLQVAHLLMHTKDSGTFYSARASDEEADKAAKQRRREDRAWSQKQRADLIRRRAEAEWDFEAAEPIPSYEQQHYHTDEPIIASDFGEENDSL